MASGQTLGFWTPSSSEPPVSNFATFDVRNVILVLDYDDTTDESIEFACYMPSNYGGGGITVIVGWVATSATSGNISLDAALKSLAAGNNIDTATFAAANNANPAAPGTNGDITYTEITFTDGVDMDSVNAEDYFRLKIDRDADGTISTDDMTGDMEFVFMAFKET